MRPHHVGSSGRLDWIAVWAREVRKALVEEMSPKRAAEIAAVAGTGMVASTALASAAGAAVSQGGITMSIGQAIASKTGVKLAAGSLAAALALSGGAMATGNLACEIPAPAKEVKGNLLVETGLDGRAEAQVEQRTIEVEGLGLVDVAHSNIGVEVLGIQPQEGATAEVRSESQGGTEVAFILDGVTRTLLVSVVDGELLASLSPSVTADASITGDAAVDAEADANANANGTLRLDVEADSDFEGAVDADSGFDPVAGLGADGDIEISGAVDADSNAGVLDGLGVGGASSILGDLGVDAEIDN